MLMATGQAFRKTKKNKVYLWLYELFGGISQWFIGHCDMEPFDLTQAKWVEMLDGVRVKSEFEVKGEET